MTETGVVREIKGNTLTITPDSNAACFGCMNQECKTSGFITAENPNALPLRIGQIVELKAPGASILRQALTALLPPALGFATGYTLTGLLFPQAGEGASAGLGVVFLFAAAFVVYTVRKAKPMEGVFTVTKVIG